VSGLLFRGECESVDLTATRRPLSGPLRGLGATNFLKPSNFRLGGMLGLLSCPPPEELGRVFINRLMSAFKADMIDKRHDVRL
jgi:hypothetical protein